MLRSLYSGISGMKVNQTKLDVIGNNIANVGTTAFKGGRVRFQDMLSQTSTEALAPSAAQGGINPKQIGLGVQVAGIDTMVSQGMMQPTSRNLDVAIDGDGYIMVGKGPTVFDTSSAINVGNDPSSDKNHTVTNSQGMETMFTRDGALTLDNQGNLLTSDGYRILGYSLVDPNGAANAALAASSALAAASAAKNNATNAVTTATTAATAAATAVTNANTNVTTTAGIATTAAATALAAAAAEAANSTPATVAALLAANTANATATANAAAATATAAAATLAATAANNALTIANTNVTTTTAAEAAALATSTAATAAANANPPIIFESIQSLTVAGKIPGDINFVDANATLTTASSSANATSDKVLKTLRIPDQIFDNTTGKFIRIKTFSIEKDGVIKAVLDDGRVTAIGQIATASFKNPAGLTKLGKNLYGQSANAGLAVVRSGIGAPKTNDNSKGYGDMLQGMLEMSNVDLAEQFTDMIVASRAFQASSKVISTGDEILQDILALKR